MEFQAVIDRFEGEWAVLLVGEKEYVVNFPKELLPKGAKEGDHLSGNFRIDQDSTEQARQRVTSLLEKLSKKESD
ncbi:MAG: DUF3006 domain-containing protein [Firmicutes bacterium]|nr:DUF3006 domain-containing protein [Bacillota bacterium]